MPEVPYFVSYDEALTILRKHTLDIGTETVALDHLYNRILAEDLQSTVDDPRFEIRQWTDLLFDTVILYKLPLFYPLNRLFKQVPKNNLYTLKQAKLHES